MAKATKNQINRSQRTRFIKAAREAECSDDEAEFDQNLNRIARATPKSGKKKSEQGQSHGD